MKTINLHGLSLEEAKTVLFKAMNNACDNREEVVRIIHGQGKHSEVFPVIKSFVRHWLEESEFAREKIRAVYRGEDGSPYTLPNAGETIVLLKTGQTGPKVEMEIDFSDEEERERRRNRKAIRADRLRIARRRGPRVR